MSEYNLKNFLSRIVLVALVGAAVGFGYSLYLPRYYQVMAKIVIVPSGSSPTAGANLFVEAGNTAEMVTSPSFQKNIFGDNAKFFWSAEQFKNSSTVEINFIGRGNDIETIENIIAKLPENISIYSRDIYGGSPFKYLLVSDPEVSAQPVRPDVLKNVAWGLGAGFILYFFYWLFVESFVAGKRAVEKEKEILLTSPAIPFESAPTEPISYEPIPEPEPTPEPMPEIFPEEEMEPARIASQNEAGGGKKPVSQISPAPDNLPISEAPVAPKTSEYQEPSDEEVKERLNRLMRGEL